MSSDGSFHSGLSSEIICIGAANIDVRCALDERAIDGTSNPAQISQNIGGAALNTARILAANDCNTKFIGLVGDDEGADLVAKALKEANVTNRSIRVSNSSTGKYISLLEPDGGLKIACNDMKIHKKFSNELLDTQFESFSSGNLCALFCDTNIPEQVLRHAFCLTPNVLKCATTVSIAKAQKLSQNLGLIDVLFTNQAEAAALFGLNKGDIGIEKLVNKLAKSQAKSGIISNGSKPLYYWDKDGVHSINISPVSEIVDVTGAGDALAAGTIAALMKGNKFADAVYAGIEAAQKVLKVSGAYSPRFV
jgi:pseudouridine kinase